VTGTARRNILFIKRKPGEWCGVSSTKQKPSQWTPSYYHVQYCKTFSHSNVTLIENRQASGVGIDLFSYDMSPEVTCLFDIFFISDCDPPNNVLTLDVSFIAIHRHILSYQNLSSREGLPSRKAEPIDSAWPGILSSFLPQQP